MSGPARVDAADACARLHEFSAVIDARSESEYAEDRLPGAINWPTLTDAERHAVGTEYKQVSPFEARKRGAALAAANIARHLAREMEGKPRDWKPLVYCWRGGQRSGSLSLVLSAIGFKVSVLDGGYKAFRAAMLADIPARVAPLSFRVVCGVTGSGKTRLLHALARAGAQVLDLEDLAEHRSSVLGVIPGRPQPTQKAFDTRVWDALRRFDPARPVYVESESKKVGNVAVPDSLILAMRASPCLDLRLADDERVALLLEDYAFFADDRVFFNQRLDALVPLRGREVVGGWQAEVSAGRLEPVVRELLTLHYDPGYRASIERNFARYADAVVLQPEDRNDASMDAVAASLIADESVSFPAD